MRVGDVVVCRPASSLFERSSHWVVVGVCGNRFSGRSEYAAINADVADYQIIRECSDEEHEQCLEALAIRFQEGCNEGLRAFVTGLLAKTAADIERIELVPEDDLWRAIARVRRYGSSGQVIQQRFEEVGSTPEVALARLQRAIDFQDW